MNQIRRGAGSQLDILTVQREGDLRVLPIQIVAGHDPRAERAGGVEAFRTRPHRVKSLQVTQCHIVHASEAEHVIHGLFDRHVLGDAPHHHGHFRLEIHIVRVRRDHDRIVRADHRRARLGEDHHVFRSVLDVGMACFMHELRVRLVILGQPVYLRRDHRREQTNAIAIHRKTLAGRLHTGTGQRMPLKRHEIVLAVAFVGLHESVLRYIIMRKTCDSHVCQSTRNNRRIVHIIDMQRPTIKNIEKKKRAITSCEGPSQEENVR